MTNSGVAYMTSKEGILRAVIIVFGCVAFALVASSKHGDVISWVLAAYIISWCFSLLSYFFIATTLSGKMQCGVAYEAVDISLSVFSFFHCFLASIVLSIYTTKHTDERIAADIFGFIFAILYAVEAYLGQANFPGNLAYVTTKNGILKSVICIFGATTVALLDAGGYVCFDGGCDSARKWAFAAFIISMVISVIIELLHVTGVGKNIGEMFSKVDFFWSIFSFLNYLVAAIVLACYLQCDKFSNNWSCERRLASDIFGFITAILYLVEAFLLKQSSSVSP